MNHRYSIDSLVVRDRRLFGWGWFLDDESAAVRVEVVANGVDGMQHVLRCPQLGVRPDLAETFPDIPHAAGGGFMLQARLPDHPIATLVLRVLLADGRELDLPAPQLAAAVRTLSDRRPGASMAHAAPRWWRAWEHLKNGQLAALWAMARAGVLRRLVRLRHSRRAGGGADGALVVFDHAMGGGANRFRDELIAHHRATRAEVLLVVPVLQTLEYEVTGYRSGAVRRFPNIATCLAALEGCAGVVVNDLASYDDPLQVLEWAVARRRGGAELHFYLHDFHAVCPVWTLVGLGGMHCGVPDLHECARCLPANKAPFLAMMPHLDLASWRATWGEFLAHCDEITAFSPSSVGILGAAHPDLDAARVRVQPHDTAYLGPPVAPYEPERGDIATIAVVGFISEYKGAAIVKEMAELIAREGLPARIVVFGSLEGARPTPSLAITGPYATADLPGLLRREAVSLALLPSIVHETFSYVTAELMHFGVPLAVFDIGAPAERVRDYPRGRIISRIDARIALAELLAFHAALRAPHAPGAIPMDGT